MTKKRCIVLAGMLAACVPLTLAVLALLPPRQGVMPANIARIENGMTRAEVDKILGGPGTVYFDAIVSPGGPKTDIRWGHPHDGTSVTVSFDRDNRVEAIFWEPPETFMQKLRRFVRF
jgi:outer membrane protein assembly factor BamE (lipoprotein component of BamABCDE complex)